MKNLKLVLSKIILFKRNIKNYFLGFIFDKGSGLYIFKKDGNVLYTNTVAHFLSYYKKIFIKEIYKFHSISIPPQIIDCGANIGLGVSYWKREFPNAEIIAFEPDPVVFKVLEKNSEKFANVKLINKALSDKKAIMKFTSNEKLSGSLNLSKNLDKVIEVETDLLSEHINHRVDLLKIDIEDKLYLVNNVFLEYHSFIHENQGLSEILRILEECGFRYYLDTEMLRNRPFFDLVSSLNQDMQVNIWAKRVYE